MATIVNDRDTLMQATVPRVVSGGASKGIVLSASSSAFQVSTAGVGSPSSIALSAALIGITGATVTFATSPTTTLSISGNIATLAFSNMTSNSVAVTATVVDGGTTYSNTQTITKLNALGALATQSTVDLASQVTGMLSSSGVSGLGALAALNYINLSTQAYGSLSYTNVSGLGALALKGQIDPATDFSAGTLSSNVVYAGTIAATQIAAGTLAVGVVYAGTINASQINAGTISANKISGGTLSGVAIAGGSGHTPGGKAFELQTGGVLYVDNIFGGIGYFTNDYIATDALSGTSKAGPGASYCGVQGAVGGGNSHSGAKGVQGTNYYSNKTGYLGTSTHAVYAGVGGYGPFTGAHDCLLPPGATPEVGDILVDVSCLARSGISDTIFEVAQSSSANQKGAVGILQELHGSLEQYKPAAMILSHDEVDGITMSPEYDSAKHSYNYAVMNSLGEGQINVCGEGGDIEAGDFVVTSSIAGKGMKQPDDLLHNYTVARAREACTFSTASEVKTIACIYVCG